MTEPSSPPTVELVEAEELLYEFEALKAAGFLDYWGYPIDVRTWPLLDMRGWMYLNVRLDSKNFRVIYDLADPSSTRGCKARYNVDNTAKVPMQVELPRFAPGGVLAASQVKPVRGDYPEYKVDIEPALTVFGKPIFWEARVKYLIENDVGDLVYVGLLFGTTRSFTRKGVERGYTRIIDNHKREMAPPTVSPLAETVYFD